MIANINDRRKHPYRWKRITAIVEPTYHDNTVADSDQAEVPPPGFFPYDQREKTSLADAVLWANELPFEVTLYLYDLGEGIAASGFEGMTTNERLGNAGLLTEFGSAARARDRKRMIELLLLVDLADQADKIADTILADPERYGF
jgi:hypothetical protein